jgi:hypothetical protein
MYFGYLVLTALGAGFTTFAAGFATTLAAGFATFFALGATFTTAALGALVSAKAKPGPKTKLAIIVPTIAKYFISNLHKFILPNYLFKYAHN